MATFTITYKQGDRPAETVQADEYIDEGDWITFRQLNETRDKYNQVLRVRAAQVDRIDRAK